MDDFDFTAEEMELARRVVDRWRVAQRNGVQWSALWPSNGQMFDMPIPLAPPSPPALHETRVECQVIEVMAEANGQAAPPAPPSPQLEQHDQEPADEGEDQPPPETTATEDAILTVLDETPRPLKIVSIAERAHLKNNSHLRQCVRELVRRQKVKKLPENRYWLAGRPFSE